jgi:hypothetical protein
MKKYFILALVAAALVFASTAQAQALRVRADIPFDFVVGNTVYAAGTYTIGPATQNSNALLVDGDTRGFIIPNECSSTQPAQSTKLVFDRMGDTYFLHQIWVQGNATGREIPKGKAELRMAAKPAESVTVAAKLIH